MNIVGVRGFCSGWTHDNKLYIIGGFGARGPSAGTINSFFHSREKIGMLQEVWAFDLVTNYWAFVDGDNGTTSSEDMPSARAVPYICLQNDIVYIYGGQLFLPVVYIGDMWGLNLSSLVFSVSMCCVFFYVEKILDETIISVTTGDSSGDSVVGASTSKNGRSNAGAIAAGILVPLFVIGLAILAFFIFKRYKSQRK